MLAKYLNKFRKEILPWLILVLVLDYVIMFGLETILPGFVSGVFNLNLLLGILIFLLFLVLIQGRVDKKLFWFENSFGNLVAVIVAGFSFLVLMFSLYKLGLLQLGIYLAFSLGVIILIYKSAFGSRDNN